MKLLMTGYTEMTPLDEQGDSFTMRLMNTQDVSGNFPPPSPQPTPHPG